MITLRNGSIALLLAVFCLPPAGCYADGPPDSGLHQLPIGLDNAINVTLHGSPYEILIELNGKAGVQIIADGGILKRDVVIQLAGTIRQALDKLAYALDCQWAQ